MRRREAPTRPSDLVLTQEALAERWGLKPQTLEHWRQRKYGPAWLRLGRNIVRYRLSDVEAWERSRQRDPSAAAAA